MSAKLNLYFSLSCRLVWFFSIIFQFIFSGVALANAPTGFNPDQLMVQKNGYMGGDIAHSKSASEMNDHQTQCRAGQNVCDRMDMYCQMGSTSKGHGVVAANTSHAVKSGQDVMRGTANTDHGMGQIHGIGRDCAKSTSSCQEWSSTCGYIQHLGADGTLTKLAQNAKKGLKSLQQHYQQKVVPQLKIAKQKGYTKLTVGPHKVPFAQLMKVQLKELVSYFKGIRKSTSKMQSMISSTVCNANCAISGSREPLYNIAKHEVYVEYVRARKEIDTYSFIKPVHSSKLITTSTDKNPIVKFLEFFKIPVDSAYATVFGTAGKPLGKAIIDGTLSTAGKAAGQSKAGVQGVAEGAPGTHTEEETLDNIATNFGLEAGTERGREGAKGYVNSGIQATAIVVENAAKSKIKTIIARRAANKAALGEMQRRQLRNNSSLGRAQKYASKKATKFSVLKKKTKEKAGRAVRDAKKKGTKKAAKKAGQRAAQEAARQGAGKKAQKKAAQRATQAATKAAAKKAAARQAVKVAAVRMAKTAAGQVARRAVYFVPVVGQVIGAVDAAVTIYQSVAPLAKAIRNTPWLPESIQQGAGVVEDEINDFESNTTIGGTSIAQHKKDLDASMARGWSATTGAYDSVVDSASRGMENTANAYNSVRGAVNRRATQASAWLGGVFGSDNAFLMPIKKCIGPNIVEKILCEIDSLMIGEAYAGIPYPQILASTHYSPAAGNVLLRTAGSLFGRSTVDTTFSCVQGMTSSARSEMIETVEHHHQKGENTLFWRRDRKLELHKELKMKEREQKRNSYIMDDFSPKSIFSKITKFVMSSLANVFNANAAAKRSNYVLKLPKLPCTTSINGTCYSTSKILSGRLPVVNEYNAGYITKDFLEARQLIAKIGDGFSYKRGIDQETWDNMNKLASKRDGLKRLRYRLEAEINRRRVNSNRRPLNFDLYRKNYIQNVYAISARELNIQKLIKSGTSVEYTPLRPTTEVSASDIYTSEDDSLDSSYDNLESAVQNKIILDEEEKRSSSAVVKKDEDENKGYNQLYIKGLGIHKNPDLSLFRIISRKYMQRYMDRN